MLGAAMEGSAGEVDAVSTERGLMTPRAGAVERRDDVDELTASMSALKFVPPSVRFGRGGRRAGFAKS